MTQKAKLSDRLYDRLQQLLADGKWIEGTRIPTELELAQTFKVSRPVVREALARLKDEGVIDSRRGSGSFVIKSGVVVPASGFRPIESIADLIRTFEFRLSIECDAASYAAVRHDASQLTKIEAAFEAIGEGMSADNFGDDNFGDADFRFHLAIAEATGNAMFVTTMCMLQQQIVVVMRLASELAPGSSSRTATVGSEHGEIVRCIARQDPDAAHAAMMRHLMSSRYRLLGSEVPLIGSVRPQLRPGEAALEQQFSKM